MAIGFRATVGKPPTCHGRAEKGAKKCTIDGMAEEDMCWKLTIHVASGFMENMKTWNIHEVAMEGGKIIGVLVDFPWFSHLVPWFSMIFHDFPWFFHVLVGKSWIFLRGSPPRLRTECRGEHGEGERSPHLRSMLGIAQVWWQWTWGKCGTIAEKWWWNDGEMMVKWWNMMGHDGKMLENDDEAMNCVLNIFQPGEEKCPEA